MAREAGGTQAVWAFAEHEHRDLARGINRIHEVACDIGSTSTREVSIHVLDLMAWLHDAVESHITWEETWLYPEIDKRLGTPWATRAARFDHQQIREVSTRLRTDQQHLSAGLAGEHGAETRCHLFGLEALLRAHIEREERFLIPLLDDDSPARTGGGIAPASTRT